LSRYDVWVVCKDPGGTAGALPVVEELRRRRLRVLTITDGWASTRYPQ